MKRLVPVAMPPLPALVLAAGDHAGMRFLEFFAANIRKPHTCGPIAALAKRLAAKPPRAGDINRQVAR